MSSENSRTQSATLRPTPGSASSASMASPYPARLLSLPRSSRPDATASAAALTYPALYPSEHAARPASPAPASASGVGNSRHAAPPNRTSRPYRAHILRRLDRMLAIDEFDEATNEIRHWKGSCLSSLRPGYRPTAARTVPSSQMLPSMRCMSSLERSRLAARPRTDDDAEAALPSTPHRRRTTACPSMPVHLHASPGRAPSSRSHRNTWPLLTVSSTLIGATPMPGAPERRATPAAILTRRLSRRPAARGHQTQTSRESPRRTSRTSPCRRAR